MAESSQDTSLGCQRKVSGTKERFRIPQAIFVLLDHPNIVELVWEVPAHVQGGVVDDVLLRQVFDGLDFCAMRPIAPTILDPEERPTTAGAAKALQQLLLGLQNDLCSTRNPE